MHPITIRGSVAAFVLAGIAATFPIAPARADQKADCAAAYEASQEQKGSGKLREAKKSLVTCSQAACPAFIKKDCAKWLSDVESSIPTVVFSARAGDEDVTDVRVKLKDEVLTEQLDGKAIAIDPGTVTLTFESPKYGTKDQKFVVKEGQKAQSIEVEFQAEKSGAGGADSGGGPAGGDTGGEITEKDVKGNKTLAYVLAGVGVIGIGGFAYFGLTGKKEENDLACADSKTCSDDDIDPIKKKYLYADISLGVGIVSLGVATYLLLTAPSSKEAPAEAKRQPRRNVRVDFAPARGGGFASVTGAF